MTRRTIFIASGLLSAFVLAASLATAYTGAGTFVVKTENGTLVDNGAVVCRGLSGDGVGGGCLPITSRFVRVHDNAAVEAVAFQVCIDNNGDGICGGPQSDPRCFDQIFFSHADGGKFFNPLGPLPTRTLAGCPNAVQAYVVLLCTGVHEDTIQGPHSHALTSGTITPALEGSGYGDFCGGAGGGTPTGNNPTVAKAYRIV